MGGSEDAAEGVTEDVTEMPASSSSAPQGEAADAGQEDDGWSFAAELMGGEQTAQLLVQVAESGREDMWAITAQLMSGEEIAQLMVEASATIGQLRASIVQEAGLVERIHLLHGETLLRAPLSLEASGLHDGSRVLVVKLGTTNHLATGSLDWSARLWDVQSGDLLGTFQGHRSVVNCVAASPDGTLLGTASRDGTARVWNVATRSVRCELDPSAGAVNCITFSPDGGLLALGCNNCCASLWTVEDSVKLRVLRRHDGMVNQVAFSPCGRKLATACFDKMVRLWNVDTGECERSCLFEVQLWALAFCPSDTCLALGSADSSVKIWREENDAKHALSLQGHAAAVVAVAFGPASSELLASGSHDWTARVWDLATGACLQVLRGHVDSVLALVFLHDGETLATSGVDAWVRFWDTGSWRCKQLEAHNMAVSSLAVVAVSVKVDP